jgi:hypothetical protein
MADLTLFAVDAEGATVNVNTPFSGDNREFTVTLDDPEVDYRWPAAAIGLVFLFVVAALAKRRLGR